ncbi:MAG: 16S rRNA (cytosine(967)-C(5))-methyltransferase RsmB, partial [Clostridia bacterium]|nr:16S rRNA (cytosine(967)-C(5))-methyltransferase RsmB [Clostridia bacterium]
MISPARMLAFQQLKKILQDGSYSNLTVAESLRGRSVTEADRALSTTLVYGVIERKITLDYQLTRYLKQPLRKLKPAVYLSLLLGSYQILFLSKIPDHAAVNESVELVKKNGAAYAGGLVNAVLHKLIQNGLVLPEEGNDVFRTSIEYSCPEYLIELWQNAYGEEATLGILKASLGAKPVTVRVNTTKTTTDNLIRTLQEEGVRAERNELVEDALDLSHVGSVEQLPSFQNGLFHVQDASSQLCCKQLDVQPGDVVYDMCAAPGGKTFTLAERMGDNGFIQAFDLHEHRVRLIQDGAERLGLRSVTAAVGNAEEFEEGRPLADRILCDVPCAGLGIIG